MILRISSSDADSIEMQFLELWGLWRETNGSRKILPLFMSLSMKVMPHIYSEFGLFMINILDINFYTVYFR